MTSSMVTPQLAAVLVAIGLGVLAAAALLGRLAAPKFYARPLLNQSEERLYRIMHSALPPRWAIMCQVSYGAVLGNKSFKRYMSINAKRADFMVFDENLNIRLVVEYQGSGHFGSSRQSRARAIKSDRIKRAALTEAGFELWEVPAKIDAREVSMKIRSLADEAEAAKSA